MSRVLLLFVVALSLGAGLAAVRKDTPQVQACGSAGAFDFDTFEVENYISGYATAIELAVAGKGITNTYPVGTELVDVRFQGLKSGPRATRQLEKTTLRVPPTIYKSIAWVESNWANGSTSVPYGGVGPGLVSFDCGYGLGQVTSGMSNTTGIPTAKQAAIGTHYLVNLAEGVRIFADKWNSAPRFRPIAGTGNPAVIEDWYFAIWSYNGFAYSNHPMNPLRDPLRGGTAKSPIYHCNDATAPSYQAAKFGYGDYTYAERVYGCMVYPPNTTVPGATTPTKLYAKQEVSMPDFSIEQIAKAFETKHYTECEAAGFSGGCPGMDFPTAIPEKRILPHADNTPPIDPAKATQILGSPVLAFSGPATAQFTVTENGSVNSAQLTVSNIGSGIGAFRVRSTEPWVVVRHASDPSSRNINAGVVIGDEMDVVTQAPRVDRPRIAQKGYDSVLTITTIPSRMPGGQSTATLYIEPLMSPGVPYVLNISAFRPAIISTPTATPTVPIPTPTVEGPTPVPKPTPNPYPFKAVAPGIGKDDR